MLNMEARWRASKRWINSIISIYNRKKGTK
jgi:hypothetical protein